MGCNALEPPVTKEREGRKFGMQADSQKPSGIFSVTRRLRRHGGGTAEAEGVPRS